MQNTIYKVQASHQLNGVIEIPGDKSISHRAIMLAAIANGNSQINGLLRGDDVICTMAAMRQLGIQIEEDGNNHIIVHGGRLRPQAREPIYLGNSGTSCRLLAGLLGGFGVQCSLEGDSSLSQRPMDRVIKPLQSMGVDIRAAENQPLPIYINAHNGIQAVHYTLPIASAQIKSSLLLAALNAQGRTTIVEPQPSRNHTELMFQAFGIDLTIKEKTIELIGPQQPSACDVDVPADISSAAFFMVAACLLPNSHIQLKNIGINPTRDGIIHLLKAMGANITIHNRRHFGLEPIADIDVKFSSLKAIDIDPAIVPLCIDEFPIIFIAASAAQGITRIRGAAELRHKESDRLTTMAQALQQCQIQVQQFADGLDIHGGQLQAPEQVIDARHDHRIAMAMSIAGAALQSGHITLSGCQTVQTSFPNFAQIARLAGIDIRVH